MIDGFYTFLLSGTARGGVLFIKKGMIMGGDHVAVFDGVILKIHDKLKATVIRTRFNHSPEVDSVWGDAQNRFVIEFLGEASGESITGKFSRPDRPDISFDVVMTRRGPVP